MNSRNLKKKSLYLCHSDSNNKKGEKKTKEMETLK